MSCLRKTGTVMWSFETDDKVYEKKRQMAAQRIRQKEKGVRGNYQ